MQLQKKGAYQQETSLLPKKYWRLITKNENYIYEKNNSCRPSIKMNSLIRTATWLFVLVKQTNF